MSRRKIVIKGGTLLTFQKEKLVCDELDILVENSKISDIGKHLTITSDMEVVHADGMIVSPGLIDTHRHVWESAFKGAASNWTLMEYLNGMLGDIAPKMSPLDVYLGNLLGALEAINAGITTLFDWSHIMNSDEHAEAAIKGLRDSGIRAKFGYGTPGTSVWEWFYESKKTHPTNAYNIKRKYFNSEDELVTMALAIRGPEYSDLEVTKQDILMGRDLDLQISMHIGGGAFGPKYQGIQKLNRLGLLGPDLNFAHGNTLSDLDFCMLADHGCSLSITPEVELQMGLGLPATGKALKHQITCSLGVDVVTATSGNLFDQMKTALQAERAIQNEKRYQSGEMLEQLTITDQDIFKMATIGGAKTLGLEDKIGTLEIGKQADIILVDASKLGIAPIINPVAAMVLYAKESDIDTVMVAGNILKQNGVMMYQTTNELIMECQGSAKAIMDDLKSETH
ncbi:Cytosine/adenosine deaminase [Flagellimonas taeanensis]|uniref:Cytosine/adenosine deaminase n=1 Tax=Flagellimonas taeanensis TaxID=1005926 RepID=A0A1M6UVC8_9FLAO|nr:amidohydrolase family protein [Allomuricauda taeanensis]SFC23286.1 Cytosine/adenosine deaminase [Allomuricauda taeanensis]SHK73071.1 Cytosine/adenosine deaminase [Allomuricauda taeanensis]